MGKKGVVPGLQGRWPGGQHTKWLSRVSKLQRAFSSERLRGLDSEPRQALGSYRLDTIPALPPPGPDSRAPGTLKLPNAGNNSTYF